MRSALEVIGAVSAAPAQREAARLRKEVKLLAGELEKARE